MGSTIEITQNSVQTALAEKIRYEALLTEYVQDLYNRSSEQKQLDFATFRDFKPSTVKECGIFYISELSEVLIPKYLDDVETFGVISATNKMPIFRDRWVIPIKNEYKQVQNLVGYSPNAQERYIYGTAKYYRRRETLWGLENLDLAYNLGYAFVTEGITDAIRLRDMGHPNSFAMCGTHSSEYIMTILNRCEHGIIKIPDRDNPGLAALKKWNSLRGINLYINFQYKDLDEMCKGSPENQEWVREYLNNSIDWIKSDKHRGQASTTESITML